MNTPTESSITYFVTYQEELIFHLYVRNPASVRDITQQAREGLKKTFAKKPAHFIYLDYDLTVQDQSINLIPNNLFTALLFSGYTVHPTMEYPFKVWKKFVVLYHPSCTGYFLS